MRKGHIVIALLMTAAGCADAPAVTSADDSVVLVSEAEVPATDSAVTVEAVSFIEGADSHEESFIRVDGKPVLCDIWQDGVFFDGTTLTLDNADIGMLEIDVIEGISLCLRLIGDSSVDIVELCGMSITLCGDGALTASRICAEKKDEYSAMPSVMLNEFAKLVLTDMTEPLNGVGLLLAEGESEIDCASIRAYAITIRGSAVLNCTLCHADSSITLKENATLNALTAQENTNDYTVYAGEEITLWHHARMNVQSAAVAAVWSESGDVTLWGEAHIDIV
ncbi:MAG: hypothetical protein E7478_10240 [Ruminococcaceae bacterium]|nr:hypothetical protein [Oscillospiraceae bacterium]